MILKRQSSWLRREGGFILITMYLLLAVCLTFMTATFAHSFTEIRAAQQMQSLGQAFYLAEAGVDRTLDWMKGESAPLPAIDFPGPNLLGDGTYTVTVNPFVGDPSRYTISSTGAAGSSQREIRVLVLLTPNPLFSYGMFGDVSASLNGNTFTDSYNSNNASYSRGTAGTNGDVGTNGTSPGNVSLTGNVVVNGDATIGYGGDPGTGITLGSNSVLNGDKLSLDEPQPMPPVTVPGGLVSQGSLTIAGNTTDNRPGGTYLFDSISISGNGELNFTGPAIVYLTGTLSVSGNGIGTSMNLPANLQIYVHGSGSVSIAGNSDFYGAVYAPESPVEVSGNGAVFGAVMGRTATNVGNGGVHYDEALEGLGGGVGSQVDVLSWEDLS